MGFKDDVRAKAIELDERVTALENLARQIRVPNAVAGLPVRPASTVVRDVTGTAVRSGQRSTLDYGAVAYGLSEIKRKVAGLVGDGDASALRSEYAGTVQYFADVFTKADPQFDADEFKRAAGA